MDHELDERLRRIAADAHAAKNAAELAAVFAALLVIAMIVGWFV